MYAQWRLAQAAHLVLSTGSIQYAFQPLAFVSSYKFSRACRVFCVAVSTNSSSKNHTKRRMEWAKLRSLFRANHPVRQNASIRLLITSHMVMRQLLSSDAALITLFCELDQLTTVRCTRPSSCSSGLKSDFFCSADKMPLHQPAIDVRILNRYKNKTRLIKENWTHRIEEKSLRHVATVVKFLDLNKLSSCKYDRKMPAKKLTCVTFLCMIEFRNKR